MTVEMTCLGSLVRISGNSYRSGPWTHEAGTSGVRSESRREILKLKREDPAGGMVNQNSRSFRTLLTGEWNEREVIHRFRPIVGES